MRDLQDREVVSQAVRDAGAAVRDRGRAATRACCASVSARATAAEVAQVELVGSEYNPRAKAEAEARRPRRSRRPKGVGGRLRAAAERLRGKKDDDGDGGKKRHRSRQRASGARPRRHGRPAAASRSYSRSNPSRARRRSDAGGPFCLSPHPQQPLSNPRLAEGVDGKRQRHKPNVERQVP